MSVLALLLAAATTTQPLVQPGGSAPALLLQAATPEISASTSASISLAYTLRNTTPNGMTLLLGDLKLDGKSRETVWRRLDSNQTVTEVTRAPKSSLAMLLQADAGAPGLYVASIRPKGGSGEIGAVLLDRRKGAVKPANILAPTAPSVSSTGSKTKLTFRVRNVDQQALPLTPPVLIGLSRVVDGQGPEGVILDEKPKGALACNSEPDKMTGLVNLAPGEACDATLELPKVGPGAYEVQTQVGGPDGEPATASLEFIKRYPLWIALLIAALGSGVGALVQWWRATGRRRALGLEEAERLLRIARPLAATAKQLKCGDLGPWIRDLGSLIHDIGADRLVDWETPLRNAARRLKLIEWWLDREEEIQASKLAGQPLADARAKAASVLTDPEKDNTVVQAALDALQNAMLEALKPIAMSRALMPPLAPKAQKKPGLALRHSRCLFDVMTVVVIWIIASLLAVQATWASDSAWGSLSDIITLVGISLGIQAGGAAALATVFTPRPSPLQ